MRLSRLLLHALPLLFLLVACSPRSTESTATPTVSKPRSPTPAITPTPTLTASPRPTQTQEPAPSAASKATPALPLRFGNAYSPSLSADGRYLSFVSFVDNRSAIYLFNRSTGEYQFLDEGWSVAPRFSPDGRYMVYLDISSQGIVYVYDRSTGESEPVNLSSTGTLDGQGACCPTISEDVRYVAFGSLDDNLAEGGILEEWDVFVHDRQAGTTELVNRTYDGGLPDGASESPVISGDGRYIAFWSWASNLVPEDTQQCENGETTGSCGDIFVSDRQTGTVERIEVGDIRALGRNGYEPSLSADGRFLAFYSQIYDRELQSFESICPEVEPGHCAYSPKLSAHGRYVAFHDGDQVFVYDRQTRTARQVSVSSSGEPADRASGFVLHYEGFFSSLDISPDGRWIAFTSLATNLVPGMIKPEACTQSAVILYDGPHCYDLYLHDLETGETRLVNQ